jgi:hypothetical protein
MVHLEERCFYGRSVPYYSIGKNEVAHLRNLRYSVENDGALIFSLDAAVFMALATLQRRCIRSSSTTNLVSV